MKGFNYYRIKTNWLAEKEDGSLEKARTEELVFASSYTEAEILAHDLIEKYQRSKFGTPTFEIIKTKIDDLLYSEVLSVDDVMTSHHICCYFEEADNTGVGLYQVKVYYTWTDDNTGKEKHSTETIFIPAYSNTDATKLVLAFLEKSGETRDYIVRDTKFDKAEAIFWSQEHYERVINRMS